MKKVFLSAVVILSAAALSTSAQTKNVSVTANSGIVVLGEKGTTGTGDLMGEKGTTGTGDLMGEKGTTGTGDLN